MLSVMTPADSYAFVCKRAEELGIKPRELVMAAGLTPEALSRWRTGQKGMGRKAKAMIERVGEQLPQDRQRVLRVLCSPWDGRVEL
jgi:hypothetical protein